MMYEIFSSNRDPIFDGYPYYRIFFKVSHRVESRVMLEVHDSRSMQSLEILKRRFLLSRHIKHTPV